MPSWGGNSGRLLDHKAGIVLFNGGFALAAVVLVAILIWAEVYLPVSIVLLCGAATLYAGLSDFEPLAAYFELTDEWRFEALYKVMFLTTLFSVVTLFWVELNPYYFDLGTPEQAFTTLVPLLFCLVSLFYYGRSLWRDARQRVDLRTTP